MEGCSANTLSFSKCLVQEFVSLFRHVTSELSFPWLQVHHWPPLIYLSQEPMGYLHAFAITKICCQQACRGLGQNCFTLDTIQNGSSWQNKKSVFLFVVCLFVCLFVSLPFSEFTGNWPVYLDCLLHIGHLFQHVLSCCPCLLFLCGVLLLTPFYFSIAEFSTSSCTSLLLFLHWLVVLQEEEYNPWTYL